jgi:hypothetical protein
MPPTIIVTVGRLEFPPAAAPPAEEEPPDEQAASPRAATHAAAAIPSKGFLRDMNVLLDVS